MDISDMGQLFYWDISDIPKILIGTKLTYHFFGSPKNFMHRNCNKPLQKKGIRGQVSGDDATNCVGTKLT